MKFDRFVIITIFAIIFGALLGFTYATAEMAEDILPEWNFPPITVEEERLVCSIVMHEGNGREMYIAIAQCIKNARDINNWSIKETISLLYGAGRDEWTEEVTEIVHEVFWNGLKITDEPIEFYYAEDLCYSEWHETQDYCFTILNTRFFKAK